MDLSKLSLETVVEPRLKVRLSTSTFSTTGRIVQQKKIYFFKSPNPEHLIEVFEEDVINAGSLDEVITNLHSCEDGIYELDTCNISRDWETGWVDGWDWRLDRWED